MLFLLQFSDFLCISKMIIIPKLHDVAIQSRLISDYKSPKLYIAYDSLF